MVCFEMARVRTWKVIEMGEGFIPDSGIYLACPHCFYDASLPYREIPDNPVIASFGLNLVFDRPGREIPYPILPDEIQCRRCRHSFVGKDKVEQGVLGKLVY